MDRIRLAFFVSEDRGRGTISVELDDEYEELVLSMFTSQGFAFGWKDWLD